MSRFQAVPISAAVVDAARARLSEGDPTVVRVIVEKALSSPCRRCLCDGEPGEAMLLFTHKPFTHVGPYAESGPVFAHEHACGGDDIAPNAVPAMTTQRAMVVVRAYDHRHFIHDAKLTPGIDAAAQLRALFADDTIAYAHVRSATYGCFTYRVERTA
jgi:hypothetical protein